MKNRIYSCKNNFDYTLVSGIIFMIIGYILLHDLLDGTLFKHSNWDSYTLQALAWLDGRLDLGLNYEWLELAFYNGKWYSPFPVIPTFIMLPFAVIFGVNTPNNFIVMLYAVISAVFSYLCLKNKVKCKTAAMFAAVVFVFGSNALWMSTIGAVWFQAQLLNLLLCFAGIYFFTSGKNVLSLTLIALAAGCRPFSIIFLTAVFLCLTVSKIRLDGKKPTLIFIQTGKYVIIPVIIGFGYLYYNYIRFDNFLDFGRAYLPEFARNGGIEFSVSYMPDNLYRLLFTPILLLPDASLSFPLFNGFLFYIANPIFLIWFIYIIKDILKKKLCSEKIIIVTAFILNLLLLASHRTLGGWQFGARYTVDLIPYVLFYVLFCSDFNLKKWDISIGIFAVMFNIYGALAVR